MLVMCRAILNNQMKENMNVIESKILGIYKVSFCLLADSSTHSYYSLGISRTNKYSKFLRQRWPLCLKTKSFQY